MSTQVSIDRALLKETIYVIAGLIEDTIYGCEVHCDDPRDFHPDPMCELRDRLEAALAEEQASFDLRWKADMRGIALWREGHPERELTWPDHGDLVCWLLARLDASEAACDALNPALPGLTS